MDSPFFSDHWSYPSRRRYYYAPASSTPSAREIPVHRPISPPIQKVVEIPVQYVSSQPSRSDSAVKIQKFYRGFLARKSVKKIAEIRRDVNEIEKRILDKESVELIKRDSRERLRLNELLMNLLFKLDSVRGVDAGVRDCRKAVIKKAIALQEIIDAIVSSDQTPDPDRDAEITDEPKDDAKISDDEPKEDAKTSDELKEDAKTSDETVTPLSNEEKEEKLEIEMRESNQSDEAAEEDADLAVSISEEFAESAGTSQTESQADSSANPQSLTEGDGNDGEEKEAMEDENEANQCSDVNMVEKEAENKRSRELLERMMEDNEKMMGLMAELFERNEMQTRLLGALSQRVGQLEKAFMCERLRKKKKKNANAGSVDCVESTRDYKKCGGKKE